jgi:hypothetical protein
LPTLPIARFFSFAKVLIVVSFMMGLAACGGGGAKAPSTGQTSGGVGNIPGVEPGATSTATSLQLLVSKPTMPSAGNETIGITVVVLNAAGRALTDKLVDVIVTDSVTSGFAFLTNTPTKTDTDGLLIGKLNLGTNKQNRTITIKAKADNVETTNTVDVVGTEITLSGTTSLVLNQTTTVTISLKDSAGNPLQGAPVAITSRAGNELRDSSDNLLQAANPPTTNRSGQVVVKVKAVVSGTDVITASALGATNTATLTISGSSFAFVQPPSPATDTNVVVNTDQTIRVRWVEGGVPQNGQVISLSATRGTITPSSGTTNAQGELDATIRSSSAGEAIVQASAASGTPSTTLKFIFVTTSASSVNVQADRTTVSINANGSDTSRATVSAVVRDSANNLVKDARVQFQITQDVTGGRLSGTEDITDVSGTATVDYIAGTTSSSNQGVIVTAKVVDVNGNTAAVSPANLSNTVNLTVAGQSLFIRLSTDNKVASTSPNFTKLFSALVTDAAGNPVTNARVQFEIKPAQPPVRAYGKGAYFVKGARWEKGYEALCFNEDLNLNGVLDALISEDLNYNGKLDPDEDINNNGFIDLRVPPSPAIDIGDIGGLPLSSEDVFQGNGILDPGEDIARVNGVLDFGEDTNSNGKLDPGEDIPQKNGILDDGEDLKTVAPNEILDSNEDLYQNGILDPAERLHIDGIVDVNEDFNRDGSLTPGNVATATSNIVTDALGFATTTVAYSQNFANWATMTLTAKVSVAGSETTSSVTFTLPGLAADYINITADPPGRISPFGQRRNCSSRF